MRIAEIVSRETIWKDVKIKNVSRETILKF